MENNISKEKVIEKLLSDYKFWVKTSKLPLR